MAALCNFKTLASLRNADSEANGIVRRFGDQWLFEVCRRRHRLDCGQITRFNVLRVPENDFGA